MRNEMVESFILDIIDYKESWKDVSFLIQTFNQHVVKQRNKSLILHAIKDSYPISRATLASETGLNKGTVSSLVSELLDEKIILESGPGISNGGRRPVMLLFHKTAGYAVGIDIGVNYILALLTDLEGDIVLEKRITINETAFDITLDHLTKVIDGLIKAAPPSTYGVVGIGIGVPGTISKTGQVLLAPNLGWKNVELKSFMEEMFRLPVIIQNEANAGAYGEKRFGAGQAYTNQVYISGGIGIGVGLILNNKLYLGQDGLSGELGHMTIQMDGPTCNCGNQGCWELYASERALLKMAEDAGISKESLTLEALIDLAEANDSKTTQLLSVLSRNLAIGLKNIITIFNPEQLIIGNRLASLRKWIADDLHKQLQSSKLTNPEAVPKIHFSELNIRSAALGVSAFSTEHFIKLHLQSQA